jgi:hypothetical protein
MALIPGTLPNGTKYPNDPQSLLDTFAAYMTSPEVKKNYPTVTVAAPASSGAVTFNAGGQDELIYLDIGAAITGLTINFPSDANSVIGQTVAVFARSAVNATVTYPIGTEVPAAPTSLSAGIMYSWTKVAASTWAGEVKSAAGWAAATGTATRTTFATSTVTVADLAQRVKALIDDLTTLGILRS